MKKINKDDFVILNDREKDEAMGGYGLMDETDQRTKIACFLNYKLYACASWEAHCDSHFKYGCDGGYIKCGGGFTIKPI